MYATRYKRRRDKESIRTIIHVYAVLEADEVRTTPSAISSVWVMSVCVSLHGCMMRSQNSSEAAKWTAAWLVQRIIMTECVTNNSWVDDVTIQVKHTSNRTAVHTKTQMRNDMQDV